MSTEDLNASTQPDRSIREQVVGGFRLTCYVLAGFAWLVVVLLAISTLRYEPTVKSSFAAVLALVVASIIAYRTIRIWAWLLPATCLVAAINALGPLMTGQMRSDAIQPISRMELAALILAFSASVALSVALLRTKLGTMDRIAFVASVLGILYEATTRHFNSAASLFFMPTALLLAWTGGRFRRAAKGGKGRRSVGIR